jgi:hypothetical protein
MKDPVISPLGNFESPAKQLLGLYDKYTRQMEAKLPDLF